MRKVNVLVTGRPGIGKTTLVMRVVEEIRNHGFKVGGFISREERAGGSRIGFILIDLATGEQAYLARVGTGAPRIGKYVVLVDNLKQLGVKAVIEAIGSADLVVIDEIGPMELLSQAFKRAVVQALDSPKPVLATVHYRARDDPFGRALLSRDDYHMFTVTENNRESLYLQVAKLINASLRNGLHSF
ncbi:MAG: NTPase [Thermofilaceae archaeon]